MCVPIGKNVCACILILCGYINYFHFSGLADLYKEKIGEDSIRVDQKKNLYGRLLCQMANH